MSSILLGDGKNEKKKSHPFKDVQKVKFPKRFFFLKKLLFSVDKHKTVLATKSPKVKHCCNVTVRDTFTVRASTKDCNVGSALFKPHYLVNTSMIAG